MAFSIPSSVFNIYDEVCDELLNNNRIGKNCKLIYPKLSTQCPNCVYAPGGSNVYQQGGPNQFTGICPYCDGKGVIYTDNMETIRLRIYWTKKEWQKFVSNLQFPDGVVMTIGFIADLPKILQANEVILNSDIEVYNSYRYKLAAEPFPHGFGKNKYFMAFWKRGGE